MWCLGVSLCRMGECRQTALSRSYHQQPITRGNVALFFFQVLWPMCHPSKIDIFNNPRVPYFTSVESFTKIYKFSTGLGGSFVHKWNIVSVTEFF